MKTVTVVCPVHNEEESVPFFYGRLLAACKPLTDRYAFRTVFVNNASEDGTLSAILRLRERDSSVHVITHSRNFGYQASVMSGLCNTEGDATVIIDVDCEDPPEMIPSFIQEWEAGCDIVYGLRYLRPEPFPIVWMRRIFYRLTHLIADWDFVIDMAEFSLISDRVRREILRHRSTFPFIRSDVGFVGFRRKGIPYSRERRRFGRTHYNLVRMTTFAIAGILSASTFPLRLVAYSGVPLVGIDALALLHGLVTGRHEGLPSILLLNVVFGVFALTVFAMYLSRIYKDGIGRPNFIVDWRRTTLDPSGALTPPLAPQEQDAG